MYHYVSEGGVVYMCITDDVSVLKCLSTTNGSMLHFSPAFQFHNDP